MDEGANLQRIIHSFDQGCHQDVLTMSQYCLQPRMTINRRRSLILSILKMLERHFPELYILNIQSYYETKKSVNSKTKVQKFDLIIQTKMHFL